MNTILNDNLDEYRIDEKNKAEYAQIPALLNDLEAWFMNKGNSFKKWIEQDNIHQFEYHTGLALLLNYVVDHGSKYERNLCELFVELVEEKKEYINFKCTPSNIHGLIIKHIQKEIKARELL